MVVLALARGSVCMHLLGLSMATAGAASACLLLCMHAYCCWSVPEINVPYVESVCMHFHVNMSTCC